MPILDPPSLLELVLIVCCHLLELSVYNSVHFKNKVVSNSKNPVKRKIHYNNYELFYLIFKEAVKL